MTFECAIKMENLSCVLKMNNNFIKVEAGMRVRELYDKLDRYNLALSGISNVDMISVGGGISKIIENTQSLSLIFLKPNMKK